MGRVWGPDPTPEAIAFEAQVKAARKADRARRKLNRAARRAQRKARKARKAN